MAFNFSDFQKNMSELVDDASKKVRQYTPDSFSKEKQFVNAIVASLALMILADKKAETSEVVKALDIIKSLDEVKELQMQKEAIELFEMHIEKLSSVMENEMKFVLESSKLIADIVKIKDSSEYIIPLKSIIDFIANSDGDISKEELEMKDRILSELA